MRKVSTYSEQLRDPRWQKVRLKKLEAAGWCCERCEDSKTTLNVHHVRYIKGRKPWEYEQKELQVLCEPCHVETHELEHFIKEVLHSGRLVMSQWGAALLTGYMEADFMLSPELAARGRAFDDVLFDIGIAASMLRMVGAEKRAEFLHAIAKELPGPQGPVVESMLARWTLQVVE